MNIDHDNRDVRLALVVSTSFHFLVFGILLSLLGPTLAGFLHPQPLSDEPLDPQVISLTLDAAEPDILAADFASATADRPTPARRRTPERFEPTPESPNTLPTPLIITRVPPVSEHPPAPLAMRQLPTLKWTPETLTDSRVNATAVASQAGSPAGPTAGTGIAAPDLAPGYLNTPPPIYPDEALRRRQEGVVLLAVAVDERGATANVSVMTSSGYPLLDRAAMDTVRRWQFVPARVGDRAVAVTAEVPIRFSLSGTAVF